MGNKESSPSETPFHGKPENNEANHDLEKARLAVKQAEKKFKKRFEKYEPYDLSEIGSIFEKARKKADISAFYIAQKRINLIIRNSKLVYKILKKKRASNNSDDYGESLDNPDDYFDALDKANNLKEQLEIEIAELQLEMAKQAGLKAEHNKKLLDNISTSELNNSISSSNSNDENMKLDEARKYLKFSKRKIYQKAENHEMPCHQEKPGSNYIFIKSELDKWVRDGMQKTGFSKNVPGKKSHQFTFKVPLAPFTNVFIDKGYLTPSNAEKLVNRFNPISPIKNDTSKIE
jgi:excisionase family DNA binding protein